MVKYKKEIKKIFILLSLLCCIITIYQIVKTYAVFHSELSGTSSSDIAKWHIMVNGDDITTQEFVIGELITSENIHTTGKKLAPGSTGSFQVEIEPMDTQVSVRYDISINQSEINNQKITLSSVEEMDTSKVLIKTDEDTYTGIIPLKDITDGYVKTIKITFLWEDDEDSVQDIDLGTIANLKLEIPILVTASQYMGELDHLF